ncbi:hypothetical protein [Glutamicibacter soli]
MALDLTPWFVGGGAQHSPEVARLLAYAATSGAEGIVEPASLAVKAQSTPNGTVAVRPGAALIVNRYAGGTQQTYVLRNASSTSVTIPATGSGGGRTDAIVARILDPQYEGSAPTDPVTFNYARLERIGSVPGNLKNISQLGLTYPAILLAKITIPASTGTITNGMIADLREVAIPRVLDVVRANPIVAGDAGLTLTATRANGEAFPNAGGTQLFDIPDWATRAQIRAYWTQVRYPGSKNHVGKYWVEYGPGVGGLNGTQDRERSTQRFSFNSDTAANVVREQWMMADDVYIPAAYRGTTQNFVMKAKNDSANTGVAVDPWSGVFWEVRFLEVADPSTT